MSIPLRTYFSTLLGVFLEYFDYTLYGFSTPFIAELFFPSHNPATSLMLAWVVFALGFVLRPAGALLFGHLADRFGRRIVLTLTILLMSIATIAIGLLPTYQQAGVWATIGLIACRILQGLAVSTEYSGCSTYLLEFPNIRRGLLSGLITSASGFGVFASSLLVLFFNKNSLPISAMEAWRMPFIIAGIAVGLLGFYLRLNLSESPQFDQIKQRNQIADVPFLKLLRESPRQLAMSIVLAIYAGVSIIVTEIYLPSYLQSFLSMSKQQALQISTYMALAEAVFAIAWGYFTDFFSYRTIIMIATILMFFSAIPAFLLFHLHAVLFWFIAATILAIAVAAIDGPIAAILTSNFSTPVRYTDVSMAYSIGVSWVGGFSPSLLEFLQNKLPLNNLPAWYLSLFALLTLLCLCLLRPQCLQTREEGLREGIC